MKKISLLVVALMLVFSLGLTSCDINNPYIYKLNGSGDGYSVSVVQYPGIFHLDALVIPNEYNGLPVTSIENGGFAGWDGFFSVIIPGSVESIGTYAFGSCDSLHYVYVGNGAKVIEEYAFANCMMLVEVILPATIKRIDTCAFAFCVSLEKITFEGTVDQWKAIEKSDGWYSDTGVDGKFTVVCSDGVIAVPGHENTLPDIEQ